MRYSVSTDAMYCASCIFLVHEGLVQKKKGFGMSSSVNDWANLGRCVSRHLQDGSKHHENVRAADEFLRITDGKKFSILESMSESYNSRIKRNREILSCIIDAIVLCGQQNLALRRHEEKDSNFIAILHIRAKENKVLADHLAFADQIKSTLRQIYKTN